jgi:ABC-2 type transport system permease protein
MSGRSKGSFARTVRQTLTIARRDFIATVFTPTFLVFLLAPMIMIAFGTVGGMGAQTMAANSDGQQRIVAIVSPAQAEALRGLDMQMRDLYRRTEDAPPPLRIESPRGDPAAHARALLRSGDVEVGAVLYGALDRPEVPYVPNAAAARRRSRARR